jgi:hypothetical protein
VRKGDARGVSLRVGRVVDRAALDRGSAPTPRESVKVEVPPLVEPPKTGVRGGSRSATCLFRFPEIEEAGMAHWPRSVRGNLLTLLFIAATLWLLVQLSLTLSGVGVWVLLAIVAVVASAWVAVFWWRRRAETALAIATTDAPSFGDVLRRRNASEASQL